MSDTTSVPVQTTAFSWSNFANQLLGGATTVLTARELAARSSGATVANAAASTETSTVATSAAGGVSTQTILLGVGLVAVAAIAVVLIARK